MSSVRSHHRAIKSGAKKKAKSKNRAESRESGEPPQQQQPDALQQEPLIRVRGVKGAKQMRRAAASSIPTITEEASKQQPKGRKQAKQHLRRSQQQMRLLDFRLFLPTEMWHTIFSYLEKTDKLCVSPSPLSLSLCVCV